MTEWIGWLATGVFAVSYAARSSATLRRVQAMAAVLWICYGLSVKAAPVVVANGVVAAMAVLSARRKSLPS
jgi:hypothetical protein